VHESDAFVREDFTDGADQRIRIARGQRKQQLGHTPVRLEAAENLLVLDLPGHDCARDAFALEGVDEPRQFAKRQPVHRSRAALLDLREGFFLDGGNYDVHPLRAGSIEHQQWEFPIACDQSDFRWSVRHVVPYCCYLMMPRCDVSMNRSSNSTSSPCSPSERSFSTACEVFSLEPS